MIFTTARELICFNLDVHYLIWRIFVCINRQIQNFIPLQSRRKICLRRYEKILLAVLLLSLHVKLYWMKFLCKSANLCKTIVGIDASQLYSYSMCQPMPTGLFTRWEYDSGTKRLTVSQNQSGSFEKMVQSYFQRSRPDCKVESIVTTGRQKKFDCSV